MVLYVLKNETRIYAAPAVKGLTHKIGVLLNNIAIVVVYLCIFAQSGGNVMFCELEIYVFARRYVFRNRAVFLYNLRYIVGF